MKSKITYSAYCIILTTAINLAFLIGCILSFREKTVFFIFLSIYVVLVTFALFFGAIYIKANQRYIIMGSLLRAKRIPMRNVKSVELFQPTLGAIRIIGTGGFMGYWGIYKEGDVGRYYAFYGKSSDCFLVRMKNGDKYVLGCKEPETMVDYIESQIKE